MSSFSHCFENGRLRRASVLMAGLLGCAGLTCSSTPEADPSPEWELVWFDEFDYTGLPDAAKWGYDVGGHGWGNNEPQYYTKDRLENARVENGKLVIEARKEAFEGNSYTSVRLVTRDKATWAYGRIEVRAKLPAGRGTWPAIWMLPQDWKYGNGSWPDNGEIDIMEHVGFDPGRVHASIHTHAYNHLQGTQRTSQIQQPDVMAAFHTYALEWSPSRIEVFLDEMPYFVYTREAANWQAWPFDHPFYLLLNIAVGGNWGGQQGIDDTIFPVQMEVEYVRVYRDAS